MNKPVWGAQWLLLWSGRVPEGFPEEGMFPLALKAGKGQREQPAQRQRSQEVQALIGEQF